MKELIHICKKNDNGSLTIIDEKRLTVNLSENYVLVTTYQKKQYEVSGQFNFQYIVVQ